MDFMMKKSDRCDGEFGGLCDVIRVFTACVEDEGGVDARGGRAGDRTCLSLSLKSLERSVFRDFTFGPPPHLAKKARTVAQASSYRCMCTIKTKQNAQHVALGLHVNMSISQNLSNIMQSRATYCLLSRVLPLAKPLHRYPQHLPRT